MTKLLAVFFITLFSISQCFAISLNILTPKNGENFETRNNKIKVTGSLNLLGWKGSEKEALTLGQIECNGVQGTTLLGLVWEVNNVELQNAGANTITCHYRLLLVQASGSVTVNWIGPNKLPIASFTQDAQSGVAPLEVNFDASASQDPDGTIDSYEWDFGDGANGTGVTATHVFTQGGNFTIKLKITDNEGGVSETTNSISISTDGVKPELEAFPEDFSILRTSTPQIEIFYSDDNSGIDLGSLKAYMDEEDVTNLLQVSNESAVLGFTSLVPLAQGRHDMRIEVKDMAGNLSVLNYKYDVVLGQIENSYITGNVVDVNGLPVAGVSITDVQSPIGLKISQVTDSEGIFKIPLTLTGAYFFSFTKQGYLESIRKTEPQILEDIDMGTIVLAEADPQVTLIDAQTGGVATNASGSLNMSIPAGVLSEDIEVSGTEFTDGRTLPGPLPAQSAFTYAFDLFPKDVNFGPGGVTILLENSLGFPVGTPIVFGVFDRELGRWLDSGKSLVVEEAPEGTFSRSTTVLPLNEPFFLTGDPNIPYLCSTPGSCQPPELAPSEPSEPNDTSYTPGSCGGVGPGGGPPITFGCEINNATGDLSVVHTLPGIISGGVNYAPTLRYHSTTVAPSFFVSSEVNNYNPDPADKVTASISVAGKTFNGEFSGDAAQVNSFYRTLIEAKNADGDYLPTGAYNYTTKVAVHYEDSEYATATYFGGPPLLRLGVIARIPMSFESVGNGTTAIVNRRLSSFGSGWSMEGLERLHIGKDERVLWEDGGHSKTVYTPISEGGAPEEFIHLNKKETLQKVGGTPEMTSLRAIGGVVYGADCKNNYIYRITANGSFAIVAGNGKKGFSGDGGLATEAKLNCPVDIYPAETGGFYIADRDNHRIRRVMQDGTIKTIAHTPSEKVFSVSEDKMRAVFFTTSSKVMLLTPRGDLEVYSARDEGYLKADLKNPSQVFYNQEDYPIVVDKDNGRIMTMYPQNRSFLPLFESKKLKGRKGESPVLPKTVSYDPVKKIYYLLDNEGRIFVWKGAGAERLQELSLEGNQLVEKRFRNEKKKTISKIKAMTYSPELGLVVASDNGQFLMKKTNLKKKMINPVSYLSSEGNFSELTKNTDGTFTIITRDKIQKNFNDKGYLVSIIRPYNRNSYFFYNENNNLTSMQVPGGGFFTFGYDLRGYLESITDQMGRVTKLVVDNNGRLVEIINPDNTKKTYAYDANSLLLSEKDEDESENTFTYFLNRIQSETLPGNRTRSFTPSVLSGTYVAEENGTIQSHPVVTPSDLISKTQSRSGNCETTFKTKGSGVMTEATDCLGNTTYYTTNEDGKLTSKTSQEGRVENYTYDSKGNKISQEDDNGTHTFEYNNIWNKLSKITDAEGNASKISYNQDGLMSEREDALGYKTSFEYDEFGNMIKTVNALLQETSFEYDASFNLSKVTDPMNYTVEYTRDDAGNITQMKDKENRVTNYSYDSFNRPLSTTDAKNYQTLMSYTPGGKLQSITDANGGVTSYEYDPVSFKVSKVIDPMGKIEMFSYDNDERIIQKINKDETTINYSYDLLGRLTEKMTADELTIYGYDRDGLMTSVENNSTKVNLAYEASHSRLQTASSTHVLGVVSYIYNSRGLKSGMTYSAGSGNLIEVSYSYDERSLLTEINAMVGGHSITWNRYYDELGRPLEDILSTGIKTIRTFDANSNLTYLSNEYADQSPLSRFEFTHNPGGAITKIEKTFSKGQGAGVGKYVLQYTYDELDRIISSSVDGSYSYDALGNITNRGGVYNLNNELLEDNDYTYSYTVNGELSQKVSKETGEKTLYLWNIEGKLTQVLIKDNTDIIKTTINYAYDGLDRRVIKEVNGNTTKYVYDSEDIIAEYDQDDKLKALYLHGPGIDDPIMMTRDINGNQTFEENELFFYSKDHLGSVHELTDINMNPIQRYNYLAYGETKLEKVDGVDHFVKSPYAYTSREWEEETGDYYYRARYYDPRTGRFLSLDSIGFNSGDKNHYRYVESSPTILNDPSGNGPVLGAGCFIIDAAYNLGVGLVDTITHVRNADIYQKQINNLNHLLAQIPKGNGKSCDENELERERIRKQINYLERLRAAEAGQAADSAIGGIGSTAAGGIICAGLSRLPGI